MENPRCFRVEEESGLAHYPFGEVADFIQQRSGGLIPEEEWRFGAGPRFVITISGNVKSM